MEQEQITNSVEVQNSATLGHNLNKLSMEEIKNIVLEKFTDLLGRFLGLASKEQDNEDGEPLIDILESVIKEATNYPEDERKPFFLYDVSTGECLTFKKEATDSDEGFDPVASIAMSRAATALSTSSKIRFLIDSPLLAFSLLQGSTKYYISFKRLKESFLPFGRELVSTVNTDNVSISVNAKISSPAKHVNVSSSSTFCLGSTETAISSDYVLTGMVDLTKVRDAFLTHNLNSPYNDSAVHKRFIKNNEIDPNASNIDILIKSMLEDNSKEEETAW